MIKDVIQKPTYCLRCGAKVYRIVYGEPEFSEEEYFEKNGEYCILGGSCIPPNEPDYQCEYCGMQFRKLVFPPDAIKQVKEIAIQENDRYYDVVYEGLCNNEIVFRPVTNDPQLGIEIQLYFVNTQGRVKSTKSKNNFYILEKLRKQKLEQTRHDSIFYKYAALRSLRETEYYDKVRIVGEYNGKRAYEPVFSKEYKKQPPTHGVYPVILVDNDGKVEWVNFSTPTIYALIRKKTSSSFLSKFLCTE